MQPHLGPNVISTFTDKQSISTYLYFVRASEAQTLR